MPRNHWATQGGNIYLESFKNRDPAKRVGNPMSKWLWDITLGMEAEAGSGMADQKRHTAHMRDVIGGGPLEGTESLKNP